MTLALAQLWLVGIARWPGWTPVPRDVERVARRWGGNPWAWAAVVITTVFQIGIAYVPPVAAVLQIAPLSPRDWLLIFGFAAVPVLVATIVLRVQGALQPRPDIAPVSPVA